MWRPKKNEAKQPGNDNAPVMLRAVQLGVAVSDLDMLTIGLVLDMFTESQNDSYKYPNLATQEDFDKF